MKLLISLLFMVFSVVLNAEVLEKTYLIKGMHCGGCESGVRQSFIHLGGLKDEQIKLVDHTKPDIKNKIGTAVVLWEKSEYKGQESDCKLAKAVKKNPGYVLYWDEKNQNPCNL
ncbi:MAG: hypothetical protein VX642_06500 [Bdellovibrionota bacterium]|nr:hypothetical protein [Bdellovibrionota bacterium]